MKLYVGNLAYRTTSESLRNHFEQFGTVSDAVVISDRESGRSKGFGFVEMPNDNEANDAIVKTEGQELDDRVLKVNEARPKEQRTGGGGYSGGGGRPPRRDYGDRGGDRGGRGDYHGGGRGNY